MVGRGFRGTVEARFEHYIRRSDTCWLWAGPVNPNGYPTITDGATKYLLHRWAYEHFVGPIPQGMWVDHMCEVILCANPAHLQAVTPSENTRLGWTGHDTF